MMEGLLITLWMVFCAPPLRRVAKPLTSVFPGSANTKSVKKPNAKSSTLASGMLPRDRHRW
jgi:hypothetical protein